MPISHLESFRNSWSDNLKEVNLWKWNWWVCVSIIIWFAILIVIKRCLHSTFYLSSHFLLQFHCGSSYHTTNDLQWSILRPHLTWPISSICPFEHTLLLNTLSLFGFWTSLFAPLLPRRTFFLNILYRVALSSKSLSIRGLPNTHLFPSLTLHQQILKDCLQKHPRSDRLSPLWLSQ